MGKNTRLTAVRSAAIAALLPMLALTACSSQGGRPSARAGDGGGQVVSTRHLKIAMVTHSGPGDTFWDTVRKGAEEAAKKDNVEFLYASDPEGGRQAQLVQQYIDQGVDGIAVTLAKPEALKDVLAKAKAKGIPVVTLNAGESQSAAYGAFAHFGSDERKAGEAVGAKIAAEGGKHPICVIHEQGNVGHESRCAGIKAKVPGTENLYVQGTDMTQVQSTVTAKLQSTKAADVVVGLGAPYTMTIVRSKAEAGSSAKVVSFDLNKDLAQGIKSGTIDFTVDQQPWLQGYMSVDSIWQRVRGGFEIGGGQPVLTGPFIIDKSNVETILEHMTEGVR